jgi:hypothetical protein
MAFQTIIVSPPFYLEYCEQCQFDIRMACDSCRKKCCWFCDKPWQKDNMCEKCFQERIKECFQCKKIVKCCHAGYRLCFFCKQDYLCRCGQYFCEDCRDTHFYKDCNVNVGYLLAKHKNKKDHLS